MAGDSDTKPVDTTDNHRIPFLIGVSGGTASGKVRSLNFVSITKKRVLMGAYCDGLFTLYFFSLKRKHDV
uniref:Uncharacterized protein n=1 Tax=Periophthalmus magnuspinnatus TaxID=409849 RepID=A0A3B4APU6_9GOBI